jgi:hypothetical protein
MGSSLWDPMELKEQQTPKYEDITVKLSACPICIIVAVIVVIDKESLIDYTLW